MENQGVGTHSDPFFDLLQPTTPVIHSSGGNYSQNGPRRMDSANATEFDFKNDDVLPSYDFQPLRSNGHSSGSGGSRFEDVPVSGSNNTRQASPPPSSYSPYEPICRPRDPPITYEKYESARSKQEHDKEAYDSATVAAVERTMKKYADNLLRVLEGMSGRLSQLEATAHRLEQSVEKSRGASASSFGEVDGRMRMLENMVREVQRGVQILRDKQEITEAQFQLKLQQDNKHEAAAAAGGGKTISEAQPPPTAPPPVPSQHHQVQAPTAPPPVAAQHHQPQAPPAPQHHPDLSVQIQVPQQQLPPPPSQLPPPPSQLPPPPSQLPPPPPFYNPPQALHGAPLQQASGPQMHPPVQQPEAPPYPPQVQAPAPPGPPPPPPQSSISLPVNYAGEMQQPPYSYPPGPPRLPHPHHVPPPQVYESMGRTGSGQLALPPPPFSPQQQVPAYELPPPPASGGYGGSYRIPQAAPVPSSGGYPHLPTAQPVHSSRPASRSGVDEVIDKVAAMGFPREQVRSTVQRMTENGQAVDMNLVLDKLMSEAPKSGWFGR